MPYSRMSSIRGTRSLALVGEGVGHAGRHFGEGLAFDDARFLEGAKAKRKSAGADAFERAFKFTEAAAVTGQVADHQKCPLAGDYVRGATDGALVVVDCAHGFEVTGCRLAAWHPTGGCKPSGHFNKYRHMASLTEAKLLPMTSIVPAPSARNGASGQGDPRRRLAPAQRDQDAGQAGQGQSDRQRRPDRLAEKETDHGDQFDVSHAHPFGPDQGRGQEGSGGEHAGQQGRPSPAARSLPGRDRPGPRVRPASSGSPGCADR